MIEHEKQEQENWINYIQSIAVRNLLKQKQSCKWLLRILREY